MTEFLFKDTASNIFKSTTSNVWRDALEATCETSIPAFTASLTGNAICETSLPAFSASLSDEYQIDTSLPALTAALEDVQNIDTELPAFEAGAVLLHEDEAWNAPELPAFTSALTDFLPLKITIDHTKFNSTLTDFPLCLNFSGACGQSDFDAGILFDVLQTDDNRKKISVTTDDQQTECYVEIEPGYDFTTPNMVLWVRVPTISHTEDTVLYLFFDPKRDDNTDYVGDTGDTAAAGVWDSGYSAVYHMASAPGGAGSILDSTAHGEHGTPSGLDAIDLIAGQVGPALDVEDGYFYLPDTSNLELQGDLTIEVIAKGYEPQSGAKIVSKANATNSRRPFQLKCAYSDSTPYAQASIRTTDNNYWYTDLVSMPIGEFVYLASTIDSSAKTLTLASGTTKRSTTYAGTRDDYEEVFKMGSLFAGAIDELRFSNVVRSDDWILASEYNCQDGLVTYESDYTPPVFETTEYVFYSSHINNVELPAFTAIGRTNAVCNAVLPAFRASIGFFEIDTALPRFAVAAESISDLLATVAVTLPGFKAAGSAVVDLVADGNATLPKLSALVNGSSGIPPVTIGVTIPSLTASLSAGHSVSVDADVTLPGFYSYLKARSAKEFYTLRYQERYWE